MSEANPQPRLRPPTLHEVHAELARRQAESVEAELCRRQLRRFAEVVWPVVQPGTRFVRGWHIDAVCDHLEAVACGEIRFLLVTMPPRHMKSLLIAVMFPAWVWADTPSTKFLYGSYKQKLSARDSVATRDLILSPWYQERFGSVFQLKGDQNEKLRFDNTKGGTRIAVSVGGALGEGGDIEVLDDPHDAREIYSDIAREEVIRWHDQTWSTRLNDPKKGASIVVQQRLHASDLAGHLIDQGGYVHLNLPEEYEGDKRKTVIGWSDPRKEEGELLWPERIGPDEVAKFKVKLGSWGYAAQFQQRPAPAEGGIFKRRFWRFWKPKGHPGKPVRLMAEGDKFFEAPVVELPDGLTEAQSWDCTFKGKKTSDFVVGQVWGSLAEDDYLLDQVRERLTFTATLGAIKAMSERWPNALRKLIEDKANGPAVIETLRHTVPGIVEIEPRGGKLARAHACSPRVESGNVYLPHPDVAPWVWDFIQELAVFNNGPNDDQVDAMTQYLNERHGKARVVVLW